MKFVDGDIERKYYINDLFIISLVYGLLYVAEDIEKNNNIKDGLIEKKFKYPEGYKEMLDEAIVSLKNELYLFIRQDFHSKIAKRVKDLVKNKLPFVINRLKKENVSLEMLAMWILYYNFVDRDVLHKNFKQFTEKEKYEVVVNTLDAVGFSVLDKIRMHRLAKDVLLRIK
jgi:hypothetical protein